MSNNPAVVIGVLATDKATSVLQGVDNSITRTTNLVEGENTKIETSTGRMRATLKAHWQDLATGAATLGASVVSFSTSFDTLEKAQVRADQANLTLAKSQAHLAQLQSSGKASADEIARAQEAVRIATDKAALATDAQHDTYTNFLAQIPLQLLSFGTQAITMYTALTAGEAEATAGANGFRIASILAFITNPVGIAIIAITTLVGLLVFNVGGLRDMFYNVGAAIVDFLRKFTPLGIVIDAFINNVLKPLGVNFDQSVPKATDSTAQAFTGLGDTALDTSTDFADFTAQTTATQTNLQTEMPSASAIAKASMIEMSDQTNATSDDVTKLGTTANVAMQSLGSSFSAGASSVASSVSKMRRNVQDLISDLNHLIKKQKEAGVGGGSSYTSGSSSSSSSGSEAKRTATLKATSQKLAGVGR